MLRNLTVRLLYCENLGLQMKVGLSHSLAPQYLEGMNSLFVTLFWGMLLLADTYLAAWPSACLMLEHCSLTGQKGSERNYTNVPISKMRRPRSTQISCPRCAFSPTWQADTNFVFFQIVFTRPTDTSVGWYADQVPCTCSCLLPDTCRSRLASKDSGAVTADT